MAWVDDLPTPFAWPSVFTIVRWAILLLALGPLFYYLVGVYSAWKFFRVAHRISEADFLSGSPAPPVSILKPLRGIDPDAYENFASFCQQNYPSFEILFAVSESSDPAVPVVQKLIADFPAVEIRFDRGRGAARSELQGVESLPAGARGAARPAGDQRQRRAGGAGLSAQRGGDVSRSQRRRRDGAVPRATTTCNLLPRWTVLARPRRSAEQRWWPVNWKASSS